MNTQLFAGKFEIQGELAKGQTGTIFYGYDLELRQEVAIKIYHSHINGRVVRGKSFVEKSKPLLHLDHPNLIKIFKVETQDDTPIVFMEFFDALSLQQLIHSKGPLPLEEMLLLAREIAEVLVHTHFQGIIHGTLHPGHVLVGPQNRIKVLDLGLSWILMDILSNCEVDLLRPLPYMPPEIAKGELLNVSSDLYCLGFMMYDMLTKRVPYTGLPKTSIMGKLAFDQDDPEFIFPEDTPEAVCELIRHMTRNRSENRLQDATAVLTTLDQQLLKFAHQDVSPIEATANAEPAKECVRAVTQSSITEPHAEPQEELTSVIPTTAFPRISPAHQKSTTPTSFQIGIILGIILLMVGVTLGYWFKDMFGFHSSDRNLSHVPTPEAAQFPPPIDPDDTGKLHQPSSSPEFLPAVAPVPQADRTHPPVAPSNTTLESVTEQNLAGEQATVKQVESPPNASPAQSRSNPAPQPQAPKILSPAISKPSPIKTEPDPTLPNIQRESLPKPPVPAEPAENVEASDNGKQEADHTFTPDEPVQDRVKKELPRLPDESKSADSGTMPPTSVQPPLSPSPPLASPSGSESAQ